MKEIAPFISILAIVMSGFALIVGLRIRAAAASDRALSRFNLINQKLMEEPDFDCVFDKSYRWVKENKDRSRLTFAWYVLNQWEVMHLDNRRFMGFKLLEDEYYDSYREWFEDRVKPNPKRPESVLRDILGRSSHESYFHPEFWKYANGLL